MGALPKYSERGFSLTELIVGMAITSIVMVGIGTALSTTTKQNQDLVAKIEKQADRRISGKYFIDFAEAAGLSQQALHLPIQSYGCSGGGAPCVRKLDPATLKFANFDDGSYLPSGSSLPNGVPDSSKIEFFKDDYGYLTAKPAIAGEVYVAKTLPIALNQTAFSGNYYATWGLTNENSAPFVSLGKSQNSDYFQFINVPVAVDAPGASFCDTPSQKLAAMNELSSSGGWAFVMPSNPAVTNFDYLKGQMVLTYNPVDTAQYFVQVVDDVKVCQTGGGLLADCTDKWNTYQTTVGTGAAVVDMATHFGAGPYPIMINFKALDASSSFNSEGFIPSIVSVSTENNFHLQTNYLFPTKVSSLIVNDWPDTALSDGDAYNSGGYYSATPSNDLIQSFHTVEYCRTKADIPLMVLPAEMKKFYIAVDSSYGGASGACGASGVICSLFVKSYRGNGGSLVYRVIDRLDGSVVISRQIGTSNLSLFTFDGFEESSWLNTTGGAVE